MVRARSRHRVDIGESDLSNSVAIFTEGTYKTEERTEGDQAHPSSMEKFTETVTVLVHVR